MFTTNFYETDVSYEYQKRITALMYELLLIKKASQLMTWKKPFTWLGI